MIQLSKHESGLSKYLRNYNKENNPFKDNFFFVIGEETLTDGVTLHKIENIEISFEEHTQVFNFNEKDAVLAIYISVLTINNVFAHDPSLTVMCNKTKITQSKDNVILFNRFISEIKEKNTINLFFSKTIYGENAFKTNKQMLWYIVDGWHDDSYYYEKEIKRREG